MAIAAAKINKKRGAMPASVACFINDAIRSGRLVPGQRLIEADLTNELCISRNVLREAFGRLEADGLVELVPNRGALVRRLSRAETNELFQIRLELEALAARLAAKSATDDQKRESFEARIASIWEEDPRLSTSEYLNENHEFHSAIFEMGGNWALARLNGSLQLSLIMSQISAHLTTDNMLESLKEHRVLANAIVNGDQRAADLAARAHLTRAWIVVHEMPDELFRN